MDLKPCSAYRDSNQCPLGPTGDIYLNMSSHLWRCYTLNTTVIFEVFSSCPRFMQFDSVWFRMQFLLPFIRDKKNELKWLYFIFVPFSWFKKEKLSAFLGKFIIMKIVQFKITKMVMSQIEWLQGTTSPVLDHLNGLSLATKCLQQKTCGFK